MRKARDRVRGVEGKASVKHDPDWTEGRELAHQRAESLARIAEAKPRKAKIGGSPKKRRARPHVRDPKDGHCPGCDDALGIEE